MNGRKNNSNAQKFFIEVNGKEVGVKELSKIIGVKTGTIYQRLYRGETLEEVFHAPQKPRAVNKLEYKGGMYSVSQLAKMAGVSPSSFRNRRTQGESIESIVRTGNRKVMGRYAKSFKVYPYKGKQLHMTELLRLPECAVNKATLLARLYRYGWETEKAVTTPARQTKRIYHSRREKQYA